MIVENIFVLIQELPKLALKYLNPFKLLDIVIHFILTASGVTYWAKTITALIYIGAIVGFFLTFFSNLKSLLELYKAILLPIFNAIFSFSKTYLLPVIIYPGKKLAELYQNEKQQT